MHRLTAVSLLIIGLCAAAASVRAELASAAAPASPCVDKDDRCVYWAATRAVSCESATGRQYCPLSCGLCAEAPRQPARMWLQPGPVVPLGTSLAAQREVLAKHQVTVVVAYADWCSTSAVVAKHIEHVAQHFAAQDSDIEFYRIDCWSPGTCRQSNAPRYYPRITIAADHGNLVQDYVASPKHWQLLLALNKLLRPVAMLQWPADIYEQLHQHDFAVLSYCEPKPANEASSLLSCGDYERLARQLLLNWQLVAFADTVFVGVTKASTAAAFGLHQQQSLAYYTLSQGLVHAPVAVAQSDNATVIIQWLEQARWRSRDLAPWRPVDVSQALLAQAVEPAPAFSTSDLPLDLRPRRLPLSASTLLLYLPLLDAAYNSSAASMHRELVAVVRAVAVALRRSAPRTLVAGILDGDSAPDMLERTYVVESAADLMVQEESRSVPPAIVIYLPDEHASLALRIDAAADAVQSFEPAASWQNPVQSIAPQQINFQNVYRFVRSALSLPPLRVEESSVAADLRHLVCQQRHDRRWFDPPLPESDCQAKVHHLILLTQRTCGACQTLLPAWHSVLDRLAQEKALCAAEARSVPASCWIAADLVDVTAKRLSPLLDTVVVRVPALIFLSPAAGNGTDSVLPAITVYDTDRNSATTDHILQWIHTKRGVTL